MDSYVSQLQINTSRVKLLMFGMLFAVMVNHQGFAEGQAIQRADFANESPSNDARYIADWIVDSQDNRKLPFLIIDKKNAKVFAFNASGIILGADSVLLGMANGDDSPKDIGQRKLLNIPVNEKITPAGRFVGHLGQNLTGVGILWVDYDAAISLHRVVTGNAKQKRLQRLESISIDDNRISSGCINVPSSFYDKVIQTAFNNTSGIIYVLPETRSIDDTFGSYNVEEYIKPLKKDKKVQMQGKTLLNKTIRLR